MTSKYDDLSDEDKIRTAMEFVARGADIPEPLIRFLKSVRLYSAITKPLEK